MDRRSFLGRLMAPAILGLARSLGVKAEPVDVPRGTVRTALPGPHWRRLGEPMLDLQGLCDRLERQLGLDECRYVGRVGGCHLFHLRLGDNIERPYMDAYLCDAIQDAEAMIEGELRAWAEILGGQRTSLWTVGLDGMAIS